MKTNRRTIALVIAAIVVGAAVLAGMAQPGVPSGDFILLAQQRVPPLSGAVSPTNPFRREPIWLRMEDIASIRPAPAGPHSGHTTLSISNDRMHYSVTVWGTAEAWAEVWAANTGRGVLSVE